MDSLDKMEDYDRLKQERDELTDSLKNCEVNYGLLTLQARELVAQIEVMREALKAAQCICDAIPNQAHKAPEPLGYIGKLNNQDDGCFGIYAIVRDAIIITPSEALREIQARALEEAAEEISNDFFNIFSERIIKSPESRLAEMAAAIRKGEK